MKKGRDTDNLRLEIWRRYVNCMSKLTNHVKDRIISKKSILCIGLDPVLPNIRDKYVIPEKYLKYSSESDIMLNFCLDIIDFTSDYAVAYKVNLNYVFDFTKNYHKKLVDYIHKHDCIAILDLKFNDIEDTAYVAIHHIAECNYDIITFNPLLGNLCNIVKICKDVGIKIRNVEVGVLSLVLTSNPDAVKYQKYVKMSEKPLYVLFTEEVKRCDALGCVVGATGHVTSEDIKTIRNIIGDDKIILFPGIGVQGGDIEKVVKNGGKLILINVGRDIIYSENPREKARQYLEMLRKYYNFNELF